MIDIDIVGGSKLQKQLILSAARYYLSALRVTGNVLITIRLKKDLLLKCNSKADCFMFDSDAEFAEFEIRMDSGLNIPGMLRCLAHECVHVHQYASKKMVDGKNYHEVIWKGKKIDTKDLNYYDQPWEIEAYSQEIGLYERFILAKRLEGKRWYRDYDFA